MSEILITPEIQALRDRRARIAKAIARLNKLMDKLWEEEMALRVEPDVKNTIDNI